MHNSNAAKSRRLLTLCLLSLLCYGATSYAEDNSIGDDLAKQALEKQQAAEAKAEATRKANAAAAAQKEKDRKAAEAETARIAEAKRKCEKNGGDWKRGKCVMPPPPELKPKPKPAPEPVVAAEPPAPPMSVPPTTVSPYHINGDGTVTDTQTGLMWKQCSEGQSGSRCGGTATTYKWGDAMSHFGGGVSFAGYNDWRMPTIEELRTLVYCSNGTPEEIAWDYACDGNYSKVGGYQRPTINQQAFPNTSPAVFWSSSTIAPNSNIALDVVFDDGFDGWGDKDGASAVRLVRSGQ